MRDSIAFVASGIADSSPVSAYRHLILGSGHIRSCNGFVTYSAPIALDVAAVVPGVHFKAAIDACKEAPRFTLTGDRSKLTIDSGPLSVQLDCLTEVLPAVYPSGVRVELAHDIRPALKAMLPFVSLDTSRRWACGVKVEAGKALATNNVVLIEAAIPIQAAGAFFLSRHFVEAVLRVKAAPVALLLAQATSTAIYPSGSWIMAPNTPNEWPQIELLLPPVRVLPQLPAAFFPALETLAKLAGTNDDLVLEGNSAVLLKTNGVSAAVALDGVTFTGSKWSLRQVLALAKIASHADFNSYPQPAHFSGPGYRGLIAGKA